jgi:uncharacterized protein (TIGR00369 family)
MNPTLALLKSQIGLPTEHSPSPLGRWLNGTLEAAEEGALVMVYEVRPEMANPAGILHGGAISAMIDDAIGMTVFSLHRPQFYASLNLSVDFLSPAYPGQKVWAHTRLVRAGKTVINAECVLRDQAGEIVARGISNLIGVKQTVQAD